MGLSPARAAVVEEMERGEWEVGSARGCDRVRKSAKECEG